MSPVAAQGVELLKDIRPGPASSNPSALSVSGGRLFFSTDIPKTPGSEIWISNGTTRGTHRVRHIPDKPPEWGFVAVGRTTFFITYRTATRHFRLWKSDGTKAGTTLVKDLTSAGVTDPPIGMVGAGRRLFFIASDSTHGRELWRSDGTRAGTGPVTDLAPGPANSLSYDARVTRLGGKVYFSGSNGGNRGRELWRSDGTAAGTTLVKDISPGRHNGTPRDLTRVGTRLYFDAQDKQHGRELWRTDGSANGTRLVQSITPGPTSTAFEDLARIGHRLFWFVSRGSVHHRTASLWASDGTKAGTRMFRKGFRDRFSPPGDLVGVHGTAFFDNRATLWRSDGTTAGTAPVRNLNERPGSSAGPYDLTAVGGTLDFVGNDGLHGREPWTSDGTRSGTKMIKDVYRGRPASIALPPVGFKHRFIFIANNPSHGAEVWRTTR